MKLDLEFWGRILDDPTPFWLWVEPCDLEFWGRILDDPAPLSDWDLNPATWIECAGILDWESIFSAGILEWESIFSAGILEWESPISKIDGIWPISKIDALKRK